MADDERYCSNCRTKITPGSSVCPACGVFAGDVFDGKIARPARKTSRSWIVLIALLMAGAGAAYWYLQMPKLPRPDTGPVRVVGDRPGGARRAPGAAINEAEAVVTLRHYFAAQERPIKSECLALISKGYGKGQYSFEVVNACDRTRLGRWKVDGKTKGVSR
jgi:hypothetical protein